MPIAAISPHLQHAFVAVEDHRFFLHPGVDPIALARAVVRNAREPGTVEGGSTITQQLARTLFLSNRKSYWRKAREAVLSVLIEAQLTKQQILELYLNRIYLSAGVYGVEAMSQRVFGKPAKNAVDRRERAHRRAGAGPGDAVAVVQPRRRRRAQPRRARADARRRVHHRGAGARGARGAASACVPIAATSAGRHGYAKAYLRQRFRDEFGGDHPPDWRVDTTFVAALQDAAERAVENGLAPLRQAGAAGGARRDRSGHRRRAGAGRRPRLSASAFNRASRSRRQPGSAFKPFVFAAALERGLSPVSILSGLDRIQPQGPDEWTPRNVRDDDAGRADAARGAARVGQPRRHAAAAAGGDAAGAERGDSRPACDDLPDVPSLALGTGLVTPLDMTAAFAVFPNGGLAVRPRGITARAGRRRQHRAAGTESRRAGARRRRWRTRWSRCWGT